MHEAAKDTSDGLKYDVLSDVLTLIRLRGGVATDDRLGPESGRSYRPGQAYFHFVRNGRLTLLTSTSGERALKAGDLVLLPRCLGHSLHARSSLVTREESTSTGRQLAGAIFFTGSFQFDTGPLSSLLSGLPEAIYLQSEPDRVPDWLEGIVRFMTLEATKPSAGAQLMISRLIDLLVIRTLREWAASKPGHKGWLSGLGDKRIGQALAAMHKDPAREWTIQELAGIAAMSRSLFAERFAAAVGEPPLRYLKNWRLTLAADMLRHGSMKIAEVAQRSGYESDAGFSRAFKACFGYPPSELQRQL